MVRKTLPAELGLNVIDALGDQHDLKRRDTSPTHRDLRSCALVCKDWLRLSRIHLFRVVSVQDRRELKSLRVAFAHHPELLACVHALHILPGMDVNVAVISLVPQLPNVHVLGLWFGDYSSKTPHLMHRALAMLKVSPKIDTLCTNYSKFMQEASFLRVVASLPSLYELVCIHTSRRDKRESASQAESESARQTYANILCTRRSVL